ncbi:MAG: hypothetical protein CMJ52_03490 [Planctomycetaceae bacterium]|nr:hypothetical protein [Planctomycetaceae bacterium]
MDSERPAAATLLTPGRSIRLPVGFAWVGVVLVAGLMIGAYLLGFSRGGRIAEETAKAAEVARFEAAQEAGRVREPRMPPLEPVERLPSGIDPMDPRTPGLNYWVVMRPRPDRAEEVAAFIRGRGLDAIVVKSDTGGLPKVIVLPGFRPGERSAPEVESMMTSLKRIGRDFGKASGRASDNFDSLYPETFRPPAG